MVKVTLDGWGRPENANDRGRNGRANCLAFLRRARILRTKHMIIVAVILATLFTRRVIRLRREEQDRAYEQFRALKQEALLGPLPHTTFSNDTHSFNRTTLVVALGGVNPTDVDYIRTPHLARFLRDDTTCTTKGLIPSFSTESTPNLWTLVTGSHPLNHGVIAETYFDPKCGEEVKVTLEDAEKQGWGGEPIWVTAARNGLRVSVDRWPGHESAKNTDSTLSERLCTIEAWLDDPPELMLSYVPEVTEAARRFGPGSAEWLDALHQVDVFAGAIVQAMAARNLRDVVNVIFVSDHGMVAVSDKERIFLDEIMPKVENVSVIVEGAHAALYFKDKDEATAALHAINKARRRIRGFSTFHERNTMRILYSSGDPFYEESQYEARLPDIIVMPAAGWVIAHRGGKNHPEKLVKGISGYSLLEQNMAGIFAAQGPAFPAGRYMSFLNIEVYSAVCRSVGMRESSWSDGNFVLYDEATAKPWHDSELYYYDGFLPYKLGRPSWSKRHVPISHITFL